MTGVVAAKFVDRTVFYANNRLVFITKLGLKMLSFKYSPLTFNIGNCGDAGRKRLTNKIQGGGWKEPDKTRV